VGAGDVKHVEKWLWRYRWAGRQVTSAIHMTQEDALHAHPDAVKVSGSGRVDQVPESPEEILEAMRRTDTSGLGRRG
jgi:hypothetical protein